MNLFQLVTKQMRQRALSSWLTILSVTLGVALAMAIMILHRESASLFGQSEFGYDVLIGAKGSPLQLTLNTVYHLDKSPGNIPYSLYQAMKDDARYRPLVQRAIPFAVGDTWNGLRIMATLPELFGGNSAGTAADPASASEYRPGKVYKMAQGRVFAADKFEAIVGSDVPRLTAVKIGDEIQATHGNPSPQQTPDVHPEHWKVVGVLAPTHTAADRVVYIPLLTFYTIAEHEEGLKAISAVRRAPAPGEEAGKTAPAGEEHHEHDKAYTLAADGTVHINTPKSEWFISGILINARGANPGFTAMNLMYLINNRDEAQAVNPAAVMRDFFSTFLKPSGMLLLLITVLVTVVAAVSILVSIYNSVAARRREIAILRALGATRMKVLALICAEAGVIGLLGALAGLGVGLALGAIGSAAMERLLGESINWMVVDTRQWLYLAGVVVLSLLAGLAPALLAYRTPVASNLSAG
jgi:putative ABC transport system permease protein